MKFRHLFLLLSVVFFLLGIGTASFGAVKKPVKKLPAKPARKLSTIGTAQLPGDWCSLGKAYTLGKATAINVTLKSAEYTIGGVKVGRFTHFPEKDQKLLVIHFTLHNPLPKERAINGYTIYWTAVDAKSENKNQLYQAIGVDDANRNELNQTLKPAQKVEAFAVIRVDAYGPVPKLMAENRTDKGSPVARYDMHGKITPLTALYADPSDPTGSTVVKKITGVMGTSYITGAYQISLEKVEFINPPLDTTNCRNDEVFAVVTFDLGYCGEGAGALGGSGSPMDMKIEDMDGFKYDWSRGPMAVSSFKLLKQGIERDSPLKIRMAFPVPKNTALKNLTSKTWTGFPVVFDLSAYKSPQ